MNLSNYILEFKGQLFVLDENRNNSYVSGNKIRKLNGIIKKSFCE